MPNATCSSQTKDTTEQFSLTKFLFMHYMYLNNNIQLKKFDTSKRDLPVSSGEVVGFGLSTSVTDGAFSVASDALVSPSGLFGTLFFSDLLI